LRDTDAAAIGDAVSVFAPHELTATASAATRSSRVLM
jgi:hypothetical protein